MLNIQVGKTYKNGYGIPYYIVGIDNINGGEYPFLATQPNGTVFKFNAEGKSVYEQTYKLHNLLPNTVKKEAWMVILPSGYNAVYYTEETANNSLLYMQEKNVPGRVVKITWEEEE